MQNSMQKTFASVNKERVDRGDGDKGSGGGGKGGGGWGKRGRGERGGGKEILGAGVIPKFVVFYQILLYFTDSALFLCTSMQ